MTSRIAALLLACFVLVSGAAAAQQAVVINGRVTTKDDGLPLPGATVALPALNLSVLTDQEGKYELKVPADQAKGQRLELRVSFPGTRDQSIQITLSPESLTQDIAMAVGFYEEITVGSRTRGAEAEKAVPVDVFTRDQLVSTGYSETSQILQALAPSFNFPRPTISDGADTVRPATLRGLGSDQLLVLVNGKRRHTTPHIVTSNVIGRGSTGVDLNAIPAAAIERIEVMRDGAAAQYGSDAIAGVINIVLKSGVSPPTITLKTGMTAGSFTDMTGASVDHSDGELFEASASYGWNIARGGLFATLEYRNRNPTNRASPDLRDQVRPGDAGNNAVPQPNHHWGDSDQRDVLAFFNGSIPLSDQQRSFFYTFGGWSRRDGSHGGFYRRALDDRNWPQIYPLGFLPTIEPDVSDFSATAGVRGARARWFWDASAQYGRSSFDFNIVNSLNTSLGPSIPPNKTEFYAGSLVGSMVLVNLDLSRQLVLNLAGPLNLAVGAEVRREGYEIVAGEPDSYRDGGVANQLGGRAVPGAQVFPGFRPSNAVDASRNSVAAYVDIEGDVLQKLRLGIAGRIEHYGDFGTTSDGKVTVRVEPDRRLVLRGAVSTGFRAPSLAQSNFSTVSTNFINIGGQVTPVEVGTFAVSSPVARALGATDLQPEQSLHYSGGVVLNPAERLELSADVYFIDIDDRIVFSGNFTGPRIEALVLPFGATGGRFFTNAIDTETTGLDLTASYRMTWDGHNLRLATAYTRTDTEIVGDIVTPPQLVGFANVLFDREQRMRVECGQPKNNLRLSGGWQKSHYNLDLRLSRYGELCFPTNLAANDQIFAAKWITDVELAYQRAKYRLAAGVQNLFDVFPDRLRPANSSFGIQTFSGASPFGFNGRFLYGRVSYSFSRF